MCTRLIEQDELARTTSTNTDSLVFSSDRSNASSSIEGPRSRPATQRRPYSDHGQPFRKIEISTIAEDVHHQHARSLDLASGSPSSPGRPNEIRRSTTSAAASAISSPSTIGRSYKQDTSSDGDGRHWEDQPTRRPVSGRAWSRTKSGSVWYERLKNSPNRSKDSVSGSFNDIPPKSLVPLPPPRSAVTSIGPPYFHNVRIEKSFTNLEVNDDAVLGPPPSSRRSSINPKRIFSTSLQLVRDVSILKRRDKVQPKDCHSPRASLRTRQLADHRTLLKRNRTSDALRRVNSILRETNIVSDATRPLSVVSAQRMTSLSENSTSSKASSALWHKAAKPLKSPVPRVIESDPSSAGAQSTSYTSSQLALRMGAQPNNTPDERATYKIKRSPSAESEEYLKVDISIRGSTSYLPSEARRIHTPPLPQDGPDGRKRGFFFDYNAPRQSKIRQDETIDPSSIPIRSASRASTVGKKAFLTAGKTLIKPKANDWYDAQLAQLEESEDEPRLTMPALAGPSSSEGARERRQTQTNLVAIWKRSDDEMFDHTIPEHLPSSPLCPRHPKYWRIVKGKGSQFRGCWIHGVGLWGGG